MCSKTSSRIDMAILNAGIAIEYTRPHHFVEVSGAAVIIAEMGGGGKHSSGRRRSQQQQQQQKRSRLRRTGQSLLKHHLLRQAGWTVVVIEYQAWDTLKSSKARAHWLQGILKECGGYGAH